MKLLCLLAGSVCTAVFAFWRFNTQASGELDLSDFLMSSTVAALLTFYVWWRSYKTQIDVSWHMVIGFALLFRVIGVGAFPILEDDVFRFLWDGRQTVEIGSPYKSAPADHFEEEGLDEHWQSILDVINYPDVKTVYGPTAQYVFALAYLVAPGDAWGLQLLLSIADMLLIILLLAVTKARNVLLYAWSPLVLKEFAFSVHPDVLGALFLLLGYCAVRAKYPLIGGVAMALAMGVKVFAIVAVPLILIFSWRAWLSAAFTLYLLSLPFGFLAAWLPDGLATMSEDWVFNAPVYLSLFGYMPMNFVKGFMAIVLLLGCVLIFFKTLKTTHWHQPHYSEGSMLESPIKNTEVPRIDLIFALLFFCMPAFNPWYLVWMLPFAVLRPMLWSWTASVAVLLAYISGINLQGSGLELYQQPVWLVFLEFGVVIAAAAMQSPLQTILAKKAGLT